MALKGSMVLGLAVLALTVNAGSARQAISVSLLECSVIFDNMADQAEGRGSQTPEKIELARKGADRFRSAAVGEARTEGRENIKKYLEEHRTRLTEKWDGRFAKPALLQENLDWAKYCGALGKDRGVLPVPQ